MGYFAQFCFFLQADGKDRPKERHKENSMSDGRKREMGKMTNAYASHLPIPYGCLSLVALILGSLTTLVVSSLAIGIAILR